MSLPEVYRLAHTAECRLQMAAGAKERDLRFVVGHLMHYESLRLRIVEIEHDISKSDRARAVQFQGTGSSELRKKPSSGQLGRRSPPPPPSSSSSMLGNGHIPGLDDDEEENELSDSASDDDDAEETLGLTRFPSGSARPPPLEPDDESDEEEDSDEPVSPEEPDQASIEQAIKGESNEVLAAYYNRTRKCPCHGKADGADSFGRVWELPAGEGGRPGVTRVVAEVSARA